MHYVWNAVTNQKMQYTQVVLLTAMTIVTGRVILVTSNQDQTAGSAIHQAVRLGCTEAAAFQTRRGHVSRVQEVLLIRPLSQLGFRITSTTALGLVTLFFFRLVFIAKDAAPAYVQ